MVNHYVHFLFKFLIKMELLQLLEKKHGFNDVDMIKIGDIENELINVNRNGHNTDQLTYNKNNNY